MYELSSDKFINLGNVCEIIVSNKQNGEHPYVVHMANGHYHFISTEQKNKLMAAMMEFNFGH